MSRCNCITPVMVAPDPPRVRCALCGGMVKGEATTEQKLRRHITDLEELILRLQGLVSSATIHFGHASPEWNEERAELDQDIAEAMLKSTEI